MMKFKTPIIYGFVVALAGSILMLTLIELKLLGPKAILLDKEMVGGTVLFLMLYLFLLFAIYFAIRKRKELNGQIISYKEALLQGLVLSLSTAIFSILFTYLFYELLYPNYVADVLNALKIKMEDTNVPLKKLEAKLLEKQEYYSTSTQSFYSFVGNLITGIAFTLLLSFFLKSSNRK
ncbi:DUF4199 domain-containing protein [Aquimarina sp. MMG016]|uniref:DUF4199 domain-containing protein n=1 Tax=Aquimarina sp. MMG016 TaxID=2822690 RepID=UPI001B3A4A57|nr:DUF4199 domain-containing protein [Aquimarina sp. MMG016]MBQ4821866.1 DUF4199 domain-containing protein [Aquimarina sp. MMG016]